MPVKFLAIDMFATIARHEKAQRGEFTTIAWRHTTSITSFDSGGSDHLLNKREFATPRTRFQTPQSSFSKIILQRQKLRRVVGTVMI